MKRITVSYFYVFSASGNSAADPSMLNSNLLVTGVWPDNCVRFLWKNNKPRPTSDAPSINLNQA